MEATRSQCIKSTATFKAVFCSIEPLLHRTIINDYYLVAYTPKQNIVFGSDGINNKTILHVLSSLCGISGLVMIWFRSSRLA
jgi:hypothetical protein